MLHVDWAADRRWGDRATYFIKVSLEQRVWGKGNCTWQGLVSSLLPATQILGSRARACAVLTEPGALRLTEGQRKAG